MNKKLLVVSAAYLLRYGYLFLTVPYLGRVLGAEAYGEVLTCMALMNAVWLVVGYGLPQLGTRELAISAASSARSVLVNHLCAHAVAVIPAVLIGGAVAYFFPHFQDFRLMAICAIALGVVSGFQVGWFFQGIFQQYRSIQIESASYVLNTVLILCWVRSELDGVWVIVAILCSHFLTHSMGLWLAFRTAEGQCAWPTTGMVSTLLKSGRPIFAASSVGALVTSANTIVLGLFVPMTSVAVYAVADRLLSLTLSLVEPVRQVYMPTLAQADAAGDRHTFKASGGQVAILLAAAGGVAAVAFYFLTPWALAFIMHQPISDELLTVSWLALILPVSLVSEWVRSFVLIPKGRCTDFARLGILGSLVQLSLTFVGAYLAGVPGAVGGRIVAEVMTAALALATTRESFVR